MKPVMFRPVVAQTDVRFGAMSDNSKRIIKTNLGQAAKPPSEEDIVQMTDPIGITKYLFDQVTLSAEERLRDLRKKAAFGVGAEKKDAQQALELIKQDPMILAEEATRSSRKRRFLKAEERLEQLAQSATPEQVSAVLNFFNDAQYYVPTPKLISVYSSRPNDGVTF